MCLVLLVRLDLTRRLLIRITLHYLSLSATHNVNVCDKLISISIFEEYTSNKSVGIKQNNIMLSFLSIKPLLAIIMLSDYWDKNDLPFLVYFYIIFLRVIFNT